MPPSPFIPTHPASLPPPGHQLRISYECAVICGSSLTYSFKQPAVTSIHLPSLCGEREASMQRSTVRRPGQIWSVSPTHLLLVASGLVKLARSYLKTLSSLYSVYKPRRAGDHLLSQQDKILGGLRVRWRGCRCRCWTRGLSSTNCGTDRLTLNVAFRLFEDIKRLKTKIA